MKIVFVFATAISLQAEKNQSKKEKKTEKKTKSKDAKQEL